MEGKYTEKDNAGLSNKDFLRQSDIKLKVITNLDGQMDGVLDLLNRTNQLNFTKIRANTDDERQALLDLLGVSGMHAGLVHVKDRFGDYGIVGFFCVRTRFSGNTAYHFTFSCRTLDMGIEQWLWQKLGKPEMKVVHPVASELETPEDVDWIAEVVDFDADKDVKGPYICLIGGCDLLQVSFYCGANRDEFVNKKDDMGMLVRYDDPSFITMPRDMQLKHSQPFKKFIGWSLDDLKNVDRSISESDIILLSLYQGSMAPHT